MRNYRLARAVSLAALLLGGAVITTTPAVASPYNEAALNAAGVISKARAIAIAQAAVGGGAVVGAVFETQDHVPHWSIDIIGAKYEYEVWVSAGGTVLRVITQPK